MALYRRSTSPSRPSSRDRNGSCTHLTLSRLYDHTGYEKCSLCCRKPVLGWLYHCTQDHDGFLPASAFHEIDTTKRLEHDAQLYTLSSSISEAAAKGHYTDKELEILWKQKIEVRKLIKQLRPNTSSSVSSASSSNYSIAATASYSTFPSTESYTDLDLEIPHQTDCLPILRGSLEPIQEVHDDLEKDDKIIPFAKTTPPPLCNFKVCHTCRPNYRERAWLSLDRVLKTPYRQHAPSPQEYRNKRLSNTEVVRNLGASTSSLETDYRVHNLSRDPAKRHSRTEFQDTVQRLLRDQDPNLARHASDSLTYDGRTQGLSRQKPFQNLAAIATKKMDKVGTSSIPSLVNSASLANGDTTFSSVVETLSLLEDDQSTLSSLEPRRIYHRRGFERMTSIKVPPRTAISHCGESTSSHDPSTSQSILSCPGIMERESIERDTRGKQPGDKGPTSR